MKHTPGPWHVSRDGRTIFTGPNGAGVLFRGHEQTIPQIAYICRNGFGAKLEEQEANAHLIAAAPELLEAMENAASFLVRALDREINAPATHQEVARELQEIRARFLAAIRKAKGESL